MEAIKLSNLASKANSIVRQECSFLGIKKSVMNFIAAFEKGPGVSFLAARMVNIVENMVSSDFQTDNSLRKYQRYIQMEKFFFQRCPILNIIEEIGGVETGSRMLGISHLTDET